MSATLVAGWLLVAVAGCSRSGEEPAQVRSFGAQKIAAAGRTPLFRNLGKRAESAESDVW